MIIPGKREFLKFTARVQCSCVVQMYMYKVHVQGTFTSTSFPSFLLRVLQWKSFSGSSVVASVSFTSTSFPSFLQMQ